MSQKPPIPDLNVVPPEMRAKLSELGIKTADQFIARSFGPQGAMLARQLGLDARQLTALAAKVDVNKLAANGQELAKLLGSAGMQAGKDLQSRISPETKAKAVELGSTAAAELQKRAPSREQVNSFLAGFRKKVDS